MSTESSFQALLGQVRDGDSQAEQELFGRYAQRLVGFAAENICVNLRHKVDPEDVVQSVLKSFYLRLANGQYDVPDERSLWRLLAQITKYKCAYHTRPFGSPKRDVAREVSGPSPSDDSVSDWRFIDSDPGPEDAAIRLEEKAKLLETLELLRKSLDERDQEILELLLCCKTPTEIHHQMKRFSLATVYRVRREIHEWLKKELGSVLADPK